MLRFSGVLVRLRLPFRRSKQKMAIAFVSKVTRHTGCTVPGWRNVEGGLSEESARVVVLVRLPSYLEVTISLTYDAVSCHTPGDGCGQKGLPGLQRCLIDCQKPGAVGINVSSTFYASGGIR